MSVVCPLVYSVFACLVAYINKMLLLSQFLIELWLDSILNNDNDSDDDYIDEAGAQKQEVFLL